jgi:hypothetical protein
MTNILTAQEAANAIRCDVTDAVMLDLLPMVDAYVKNATGRDWTVDTTIHESAKGAARMLAVMYYDNPAMLQTSYLGSLPQGLTAVLTQLEALAMRYKTFEGLSGAGSISLAGAAVGDTVTSLVGIVGATGDQHTSFETVITVADQIQQSSTSDLSGKFYRALLTPLSDI